MTKRCKICGREFEPRRIDQPTCGDVDCKRIYKLEYLRRYMMRYRMEHKAEINEKNAAYMRKHREEMSRLEPDRIIGLGYAERQKQRTLELVGRVQI